MSNEINVQIYSGMWINLPYEVKNRIAEAFHIPKRGSIHVVDGVVQSDGYLDKDLAVLNVKNLQDYLDWKDQFDIFKLWNSLIEQIKNDLKPVVQVQKAEEKPNIELEIKIDGEEVKLTGNSTKRHGKTKANK